MCADSIMRSDCGGCLAEICMSRRATAICHQYLVTTNKVTLLLIITVEALCRMQVNCRDFLFCSFSHKG